LRVASGVGLGEDFPSRAVPVELAADLGGTASVTVVITLRMVPAPSLPAFIFNSGIGVV
jgi:hypothetical protein